MTLNQLQNKKIAFLGLGIENQALLKYLIKKRVKCEITICDAREAIKENTGFQSNRDLKLSWKLGRSYNKGLDEFDILFRSPGWPIHCSGIEEALKKKGLKSAKLTSSERQAKINDFIYSPIKLFFDLCPTKNIIGVTGTKGKGTTSSIIHAALKEAKKRAWLGGNIGIAPFEFLPKIKPADWVVLELSSFQLEDLHKSSHIAVITNLTREHLSAADPNNPNYHKSLKSYHEAKFNLAFYQNKSDFLIVNEKLKSIIKSKNIKAVIRYFAKSPTPSRLVGEHNKENIAAAQIAAKLAGVNEKSFAKAVLKFRGLEHRLEFVKEINGVKYYNDSYSTTPESTITALNSFANPVILLAGGAEKNSDFKPLAQPFKDKVKLLILLQGVATPRLKKEMLNAGFPAAKIIDVSSLKEAMNAAEHNSCPGDIILLSAACASFGLFKNVKDRGKQFKEAISLIK